MEGREPGHGIVTPLGLPWFPQQVSSQDHCLIFSTLDSNCPRIPTPTPQGWSYRYFPLNPLQPSPRCLPPSSQFRAKGIPKVDPGSPLFCYACHQHFGQTRHEFGLLNRRPALFHSPQPSDHPTSCLHTHRTRELSSHPALPPARHAPSGPAGTCAASGRLAKSSDPRAVLLRDATPTSSRKHSGCAEAGSQVAPGRGRAAASN